ncbi:MAG: glycosyltransferase [Dehalococcoidia bacterium]
MTQLHEVQVNAQPIDRFLPLFGEEGVQGVYKIADEARRSMEGRVFWNVNSTERGGGVAEMLRSLLPYVRGLDIDTRWIVISGTPEFFDITKRLHHALHGSAGDGSPLGERERDIYERVLHDNAEELAGLVRPRDFVLLHDPQTAGLAPHLLRLGAIVIWRCHVGTDEVNEQVDLGWRFLEPYLENVAANVFTRQQYIPECCDSGRSVIIPPSIDPFSAKNQNMDEDTIRAILVHTGLVEGPSGKGTPTFIREDGSPGRVDRRADVSRLGRAPSWGTPLVVQVSRWDRLKDPVGVLHGFSKIVNGAAPADAELVLAGPNVKAIHDDPEQVATFDEVVAAWRQLPQGDRNRIHLACLPMADVEENAAIVNALQRHAAVIVQKSLQEGFGLTVTEAMWKSRPILASAVGGIQDQIENEVHGLLLKDPADAEAFGIALRRLLEDREFAERLGSNAGQRVRETYLGLRHLVQYADLLRRTDLKS